MRDAPDGGLFIWKDTKNRVHSGHAKDLVHCRRQPGKVHAPFAAEIFHRRNDGAKPAGIEELDLAQVEDDPLRGMVRQLANLILESYRDSSVDPPFMDGNDQTIAVFLRAHQHEYSSSLAN